MSVGKLYSLHTGDFIVDVDYQVYDESSLGWWGELVYTEYRRFSDGGRFVIELDDGRRGCCTLQKRVNCVVGGPPALYRYQFRGQHPLASTGMSTDPVRSNKMAGVSAG